MLVLAIQSIAGLVHAMLHSSVRVLHANQLQSRRNTRCICIAVQDGTELREFSLHSFAGANSSKVAGRLSLHFEFVSVEYQNPKPINRAIQVCVLPAKMALAAACEVFLLLTFCLFETADQYYPLRMLAGHHPLVSQTFKTAELHITRLRP
jgi:hypothetical protein